MAYPNQLSNRQTSRLAYRRLLRPTVWCAWIVLALELSGCALGSSPLLHHPTARGGVDGYVGFSLPIQPATARITTTHRESTSSPTPISTTHVLHTATTGIIRPASGVWPYYVAYLYDPKLFGSVGITRNFTLVGELAWHRVGVSMDYFTREEGRGGAKIAAGVTTGTGTSELYGWLDAGWLPAFSAEWSGYVGMSASAGTFRHIFTIPDRVVVTDSEGDGTLPTTASFADLLRREVRIRLPLGVTARAPAATSRGRRPSASLAAIPYMTVAQGNPRLVNCRDCPDQTTVDSFSQHWGIELAVGGRF